MLVALRPSTLRRFCTSLGSWVVVLVLSFGATMTSALGAIFTKLTDVGGAGSTEVTMMFAVDVGDR